MCQEIILNENEVILFVEPKERWIASICSEAVDRLVFWPKLSGAYSALYKDALSQMTDNMDILKCLGCDIHIRNKPLYLKEVRKNSGTEIKRTSHKEVITYITKYGSARLINAFDRASQSWHPVEMPIKNEEDIKIMTEWYADCTLEIDQTLLGQAKKQADEIGQKAMISTYVGKSPLMYYIEWLAGVENGHYFLVDNKNEIEELFNRMDKLLIRKTEILCDISPSDLLYFEEDTSTTLISPEQFAAYCFKHINNYGRIMKEGGRLSYIHACGHIKHLLPLISKIPVNAIEAITSPPLGDTTLYDGRSKCPDKCLIGGTNALLWLEYPKKIIEQIEKDLFSLPHHRGIIVSSAGVMPPACTPETIKKIFEWIKHFKIVL